ncbi:putative SWI-SNF complex subunit (Snf5) [Diplocarpon rosae]|nr:putative SWI-SNF complex subunit (Snf5) [Diplocarpon rosae]
MPLSPRPLRDVSRRGISCSAAATRDAISRLLPSRGVQHPVTTVPVHNPTAPKTTGLASRASASPPPAFQITSPVGSTPCVQVVDQKAETVPQVLTSLPVASTYLSSAIDQLNHSMSAFKRKVSSVSGDDDNNDQEPENSQQIKRARHENPSGIIGGVLGAIDAPFPPQEKSAPPPPAWLIKALGILQKKHPNERFKALMLHSPVSKVTGAPCSETLVSTNPADIKYMWLPRIACEDCPGKLYIPGSGKTVCNFQLHFKGVQHKTNVEERLPVYGAAS